MLRQYLRNTSGNFAMMFGLGAMALLGVTGYAVDHAGMSRHAAKMQNLVESGALAAAVSGENQQNKLSDVAKLHIDKNNNGALDLETNLKLDDTVITVTAISPYKTQFLGIFGKPTVEVKVTAQSVLPGDIPLNITMVLDQTGSMSGQKMDDLKVAAKGMINVLEEYDADINVSVVPFSNYVNVGLANRHAKWMDVPDDSTTVGAEVCKMTRDLVNSGLCTTTTVSSTCSNDGVSYACTRNKRECPDAAYGPEYEKCGVPTDTDTWHGCAGSRDGGMHKVADYGGKKIPGIMEVECGEELLPLTPNKATVISKIDSLSTNGETYLPTGLIWGWRSLMPSDPLNDFSNSEKKRKRALILMTDGKNSKSLNQPKHDEDDVEDANGLTKELCDGIKSSGIEIYSVAYAIVGPDAGETKAIVQDCASSPQQYFDASTGADIKAAFEDIAKQLFAVRLTG